MNSPDTDPLHDKDLATLKRFIISFKLDFIQWSDDAASFTACKQAVATVPGLIRHGHQVTLHDVDIRKLGSLPPEVHERPLAKVEFTADLRLPSNEARSLTPAQHLDRLGDLQRLMLRRLAPWNSPHVARRTYVVQGYSSTQLRKGHWHRPPTECGVDAHGNPVVAVYDTPDYEPSPPQLTPTGAVRSDLIYFGHKVEPQWQSAGRPPAPKAQIRVYVKTSDDGHDLPREEWCIRVEAVVNREYLTTMGTGLRNVGDLATVTSLRPWLKPLIQLCRPRYSPVAGRRERGTVHRGRLTRPEQMQRYALKDVAGRTLERWRRGQCFVTPEVADLHWTSAPKLTERLMGAVSAFHRSRRTRPATTPNSRKTLEVSTPLEVLTAT